MRRYGEKTAIVFSALAFALFHMNLFQFFYAFGLGLIFGYVYTRTSRLRYSVLMHMLIDSIEEELDEAKPILFAPSSVRVDRESFTGKLDKLKKMLPVQLERASALMRESERRLESAQTQANAIIASAQSRAADTVREANEQAQFLAGQENVTELARQKARGILDQAQAKADKLTQNADKYCITMMESLQQQVDKIGTGVQAGLNVLYDRQREAGAHLDHLDADDYPEN